MAGPLQGIRVVELAGLAPGPFCGMLLADFGASVIRVDRLSGAPELSDDQLTRGKRSIKLNLKKPSGISVVKRLCSRSDVLIDPFRPGILEKLGLAPEELWRDNVGLVLARITGYGQTGPLSARAGHDINYLAVSGLLSRVGRAGKRPYPPLNIVADFAGGGLLGAFGVLSALIQRQTTGRGQVVDISMTEGAAYVGAFVYANTRSIFANDRGGNLLDGGNPLYDTYKTKDGKYVAVGALEPKFHKILFEKLGMDSSISLIDSIQRPEEIRSKMQAVFLTKDRDTWAEIFDGLDACVSPVLETDELLANKQHKYRGSFAPSDDGNGVEPLPAPRLSETPATPKSLGRIAVSGEHSLEILNELGYTTDQIRQLNAENVISTADKAKL